MVFKPSVFFAEYTKRWGTKRIYIKSFVTRHLNRVDFHIDFRPLNSINNKLIDLSNQGYPLFGRNF